MAYLKGGSYVDGDLYIDGTIKVRNIATLGGSAMLTLYHGNNSIQRNSLLKFAVDAQHPQAGAVEYSQVCVEEAGSHTLSLYFGVNKPMDENSAWSLNPSSSDIKEVLIDHPVSWVKVGSNDNDGHILGLVLDPATRTWSYNYE